METGAGCNDVGGPLKVACDGEGWILLLVRESGLAGL